MKHFMTALACLFIMNVSAQTPYNPDSDGDNLIGVYDLVDFLPLYGNEFYPENLIQEEWCYSSSYDSCFVDEDTDVLYVDMFGPWSGTIGGGPIYLPDGESFKQILIIANDGNYSADIMARDFGAENYYPLDGSFSVPEAHHYVRTSTGKWRVVE